MAEKCEVVNNASNGTSEHITAATVQVAEAESLEAGLTIVLDAGRAKGPKAIKAKIVDMVSNLAKHRGVLNLQQKLAAAANKAGAKK